MSTCPPAETWLALVAGELDERAAKDARAHAELCESCRAALAGAEALTRKVRRSHEGGKTDVEAHLAAILAKLPAEDERPRGRVVAIDDRRRRVWQRAATIAGALALAAAVFLFVRSRDDGEFTPRGVHDASVVTDVRITIYTMPGMKPLAEASSVEPTAAFTGAYTSLLPDKAYALVFAVDAKREIHWLAPAFVNPNEDPSALTLEKTASETPFRSSVVFEEVADGPLSFFSVVTTETMHVSDIERLPPEERTKERLQARFAHGSVREQRTVVVRR